MANLRWQAKLHHSQSQQEPDARSPDVNLGLDAFPSPAVRLNGLEAKQIVIPAGVTDPVCPHCSSGGRHLDLQLSNTLSIIGRTTLSESLDFHDQFVLSRRISVPLTGFSHHRLKTYYLTAHPSLPIEPIQTPSGEVQAWVLGHLLCDPPPIETISDQVRLKNWLNAATGRFVLVAVDGDEVRLYLDAGGTLAAVYAPSHAIAASTVTIGCIAASVDFRDWEPSLDEFPADRPNQFWPADLTSHPDFHRLLPSHILDLGTWTAKRSWHFGCVTPMRPKAAAATIARRLSQNVGAITQRYDHCYFPLTAGSDSRALLASALACGAAAQMTFVTFDYQTRDGDLDVEIAKALAARFDLRHEVLPVQDTSDDIKSQYQRRIGYSGGWGKSRDFYAACKQNLDLRSAWVTGFGGEVGRAFYWKNSVPRLTAESLLERMRLPCSDQFKSAMTQWLKSFPRLDPTLVSDMLYLEMRLGGWASPHLYGTAPFKAQFVPLADPVIFSAMAATPAWYRQADIIMRHVAQNLVPEVLEVPLGPPEAKGRARFIRELRRRLTLWLALCRHASKRASASRRD